jgi:FAD/FMN-containing dehydrogenase
MVVIGSFGRVNQPLSPKAVTAENAGSLVETFANRQSQETVLPVGNGRSYGDTCLTNSGLHLDMRAMNRVIAIDFENGFVTAEPGVILGDLITKLRGTGWFPPVVPGTQFVTFGGALANDIHGKNHHGAGTFGCHVQSFQLLRSDGTLLNCSANENAEWFETTIGGMGLTGIITELTLKLMNVSAHDVAGRTIPFETLDGYFDLIESEGESSPYAVAWLDQLATGAHFGRGLMMLGAHADHDLPERKSLPLGIPFQPSLNVLNGLSLRAFNAAYFAAGKRKTGTIITPSRSFFFPLDAVKNWNRLYGPNGLFQHQSVIPNDAARTVIPAMLRATQDQGQASFLTVLKKFGAMKSPGLMSFPRAGHTLTLDFPNRGASTLVLLERLDEMVVDAGGAVNPYKDARMSAATFKASFAGWRKLEAKRDPAILSDFWTRTVLNPTKSA